MKIPKAIQATIESFEKLPGIGPKTAQRLTFYLLHVPQGELDRFGESVQNLKKGTVICSICQSVDETSPCSICSDETRNKSVICVLEQPLDVLALEKSGKYKGVYHVLHGKIDPLNNIGPDEIFIKQLFERLDDTTQLRQGSAGQANESNEPEVMEVILSTNSTMEGEATAMYLSKQIKSRFPEIRVTRIGRGLPVGSDIEYADSVTLERAMDGRSDY